MPDPGFVLRAGALSLLRGNYSQAKLQIKYKLGDAHQPG